jgi:hypothetical protein
MRSLISALVLAAAFSAPARAQQVTTMDSTLHAMKAAYVVVQNPDSGLANVAPEVESSMSLELRKAGVRVLPREVNDSTAGTVVITFQQRKKVLSVDVEMEIAVVQFGRLVRTGETFPMVTWRYHAEFLGASSEGAVAMQLLKPGIDRLLNGWLSANGR